MPLRCGRNAGHKPAPILGRRAIGSRLRLGLAVIGNVGGTSRPVGKVEYSEGPRVDYSVKQVFAADLSHVTGRGADSRNKAITPIINEDLSSLDFTFKPEYSPFIRTGIARFENGTQIGKLNFSSRDSLRDVIVHEELHHRWWSRGIYSDHHPAGSLMEHRFYETIDRYKRMRGW